MRKDRTKIWRILVPVLIVLLIIVGVVLARRPQGTGPVTNITPEFEQEQTRETTGASQSKGIKIPGYSIIPIAADSTDVEIDLYNPEENDVYFQISFYLSDSKELLFESKLLKPGQHLYTISLNRPLPEGEYPITIQYSTFSTDGSFTPKNGAVVDCILRAKK